MLEFTICRKLQVFKCWIAPCQVRISQTVCLFRPKFNVIFEANTEFRIRAEITDLAGHGLHYQTLVREGRPNQHSFYEASVGEFAEEEEEVDDPDARVDKVENLEYRVVQAGFIKPGKHEMGTLGGNKY